MAMNYDNKIIDIKRSVEQLYGKEKQKNRADVQSQKKNNLNNTHNKLTT